MRIATETLLEAWNTVLLVFGVLLLTSSYCAKSDKKKKHKPSKESIEKKSKKTDASSKGDSVTPSDVSASSKAAQESDSESRKKPSVEKKSKMDTADTDVTQEPQSARTPKSQKSHKDVVDEKAKTKVAAVEAKESDPKANEDLVLSVINPSRLDYSALPVWILERMESKTQEVVPEDEKPPDRPSKAGKSLKAGTPSGKDQKHSQKASKVPGARAKHSSKKPVYKAKKPSEYVSVFAGSMAPKAAGSAAPTKPTKEPAANLPATGGPVQASAAAKEPSKPGQVSATKPSVAVPATSTKPVTVAKETPKLTPAPTAVPTKQPGTTPAGTTSKPAAGPAQQQPSLPGGPVPAPAPGPPSKIPSDCVRV